LRHLIGLLVAVLLCSVAAPGTARAHAGLDYSLPTDGASVGTPIDEITVAFTEPVTLVGNGFAVLDPQNNELEPFAVTDDDTVFRLQFDPPLAGGTVAVKYEVRSEDGHVVDGSFVFVVDAPEPTTAPPTTATPATASPTSSTITPSTSSTTTAPATTTAPTTAVTSPAATTPSGGDDGSANSVVILIAVAVALAAGGFLLVRSRTAT